MTLLERHAGMQCGAVEGIEPSTKAWEAFVLPLNYTRVCAALFTRTLQELEAQVIKKSLSAPHGLRDQLQSAERSDGQRMLPLLNLPVVLTRLTHSRLEEAQQGATGIFAGGLVFHVEEMPRVVDHAELASATCLPNCRASSAVVYSSRSPLTNSTGMSIFRAPSSARPRSCCSTWLM